MDQQTEMFEFLDRQIAQIAARERHHAFGSDEYADRLRRLRGAMAEADLDMLVVSAPDAMCWLHGYQARWYKSHSTTAWPPFHCTVAHVDHDRLLHFDMERHRYLIPRTSVLADLRLKSANTVAEWLDFFLGELGAEGWLGGRTGLEMWSSVPNRATSEILEAALVSRGCTVVDGTLVTRRVRRLKSTAEIAVIRQAAEVCDAGVRALQAFLGPGVSELEAWAAMVGAMVAAGGEPAALQENVWAGTSQLIHALSSRHRFGAGEIVCADPCGVVHRYHANAARTFSIGGPEPAAIRLMELLAGGLRLFEQTAAPGVPVVEVQRTLRDYYRDCGLWERRGWLGGYEFGVALPPDWVGEWMFGVDDEDSEDIFEDGLVTNFESIVGLVLIDTFVIATDGAQRLSSVPREILVATG
jgi:Xaa-Pro aminopeptidase